MASQGLTVTGLKETVKSLEKMGVEVSDMKSAFTRIGTIVADEAKSLAPKQTGALAASIKPSKTKNKAVVRAGSARVPYAGVINYGWPAHNIEKQNFLDNAMERKQDAVIKAVDEELQQLANKAGLGKET